MAMNQEVVSRLRDFGLNSYEARLWLSLLSRGVATAGELSDLANVPRSRSYDVLESLEKKGFIILKLGKPIKYMAVPPKEAVERVKKRLQEDTELHLQRLENLKKDNTLTQLASIHKKGAEIIEPVEMTGILKGQKNLLHTLSSMFKHAEKSITFITPEHFTRNTGHQLKNALTKAKEKGVKIRILTPETVANVYSNTGQVKGGKMPQARFCVVDGKTTVLMPLSHELHPDNDFGIIVKTEHFAQSMEELFEHIWAHA